MVNEKLNTATSLIRFSAGHIAKAAEISRLKGENFNIFSILGLESAENKTHSTFIGELLNPEGSHGMQEVFLRLFIRQLETEKLNQQKKISIKSPLDADERIKFRTEGARVKLEFPIGEIDIEKKTGGRIDIFLEDKNGKCIAIENKIYAPEQPMQIPRYKTPTNEVVFLTLDGTDAKERGKLEAGKDYFLLSYRDNIKDWLQACLKEVADFPILRETIKQYIILIKKLTGQLASQEMKDQIAREIGRTSENFKAAIEIKNNIDGAMIQLQTDFWDELYQAIKTEEDWQADIIFNNPDIKNSKSIINRENGQVDILLIENFYTSKKELYGLHYEIAKGQNKWNFSLMVDHNLWYSIDIKDGKLQGYECSEAGSYFWKHFKNNQETINFKKYHNNRNIVDLFDSDNRKNIIQKIITDWKDEIDLLP